MEKNKLKAAGTSLKRDVIILIVGAIASIVLLYLANLVGGMFGDNDVASFLLKKVGGFFLGLGFISLSMFAWMKYALPGTLGKDYGSVFDEGWDDKVPSEKADRILVASLVVLFSFVILWLAS